MDTQVTRSRGMQKWIELASMREVMCGLGEQWDRGGNLILKEKRRSDPGNILDETVEVCLHGAMDETYVS